MKKDEKELLDEELRLLINANEILKYSYDKCSGIGIKQSYTFEELDYFEALTSRFSRASDILIQKIFRLIDIIELESQGTIIDRINRAEKRGMVRSAQDMKRIRRIRNEIAHEYVQENVQEIFEYVMQLAPILLGDIKSTLDYANKLK